MPISSIKDDGTYFQIYSESDRLLSQKSHYRSELICGHSEKIVVIDEGEYFKSYDEDFKELGIKSHFPSEKVISVSGREITISDTSSPSIVYDEKFQKLRYV
jgi:hypothetical protein